MIRASVTLTPELALALDSESRRRRTSRAECIRALLVTQLGLESDDGRDLSFIGIGASGQSNISEDMEDLLRAEWGRGPTYDP